MVKTVGIKLYTADEFLEIPDKGQLTQLIYGEIVEKFVTEMMGVLTVNLSTQILNHILPRKLGRAGVHIWYRNPRDKYNVRMPDISFRQTTDPIVTHGAVLKMPDLAVEVKSPKDKPREMREKATYFLKNGTKLIWLVYPKSRTVEICTLNSNGDLDVQTVDETGMLNGGTVLPEFTLSLEEIFAVL